MISRGVPRFSLEFMLLDRYPNSRSHPAASQIQDKEKYDDALEFMLLDLIELCFLSGLRLTHRK
jgi:hypothetical protein